VNIRYTVAMSGRESVRWGTPFHSNLVT